MLTEQSSNHLRNNLTQRARNMRSSIIPKDIDITLPQSHKMDIVLFHGNPVKRKRIVLLSPGCSVATCTMCPLPDESLDRQEWRISPEILINQIENSFKGENINDYDLLTIYSNGNFFSDKEISPQVRRYIYEKVANSHLRHLAVESLPQFINSDNITEAKKCLKDKNLVVSVGLQSANDQVRELAINSTCTRVGFERATELLRRHNFTLQPFLMIKPPFLTESEGITDTVESIKYLNQLDIHNPILCPTRIAPNTIAWNMHKLGLYQSPWLWSIVEVLRQSSKLNTAMFPRVVASELRTVSNPDSICAHNCGSCDERLINLFERFNLDQDIDLFAKEDCECKEIYKEHIKKEDEQFKDQSLPQRVYNFLNMV